LQEIVMSKSAKNTALAIVATLALAGCGTWSDAQKGTAIGAGVGAAAGHAISGGSVLGTIGGAAVGGVVGHEVGENRDEKKGR
jgi:osmotically inducible lipoprotein OsmB